MFLGDLELAPNSGAKDQPQTFTFRYICAPKKSGISA